jgi:protein-disulfide isomerase
MFHIQNWRMRGVAFGIALPYEEYMRFSKRAILALLSVVLLIASVPVSAQMAAAGGNTEKVKALRPPVGAKVAIIVFEDLQCPDCARAAPLVEQVAKAEKVPVVRHDFPLPMHNYSRQAAIIARYFDTKSKKLGDDWRDYVFANQTAITPENLNSKAQAFAQEHGTAMPFMLDPGGKLAAKVQADFALGQRIGIQHTPTIFVVSNTTKGEPFVEVVDRSKLTEMIESMKNAQ